MGLKKLAESSCNEPKEHDDKEAPKYLHKAVEFALPAIEEQDYLTEEQQDVFRFAFPTSRVDDPLFRTDELTLRAKENLPQGIKSGDAFVRKHLDWKLGVLNHKGTAGPVPFLPPRTAAWIILLHDLTWSWNPDHITKNLVVELCVALSKEKKLEAPNPGNSGLGLVQERECPMGPLSLAKFDNFSATGPFPGGLERCPAPEPNEIDLQRTTPVLGFRQVGSGRSRRPKETKKSRGSLR